MISAAPSAPASAGGEPCEVGVRGRDLILSRSGQQHMMRFAYLISIRNVRRPEATNVPYQVEGRQLSFFDRPKGAVAAEQVGLLVWRKAYQHQVEPDPAEMAG